MMLFMVVVISILLVLFFFSERKTKKTIDTFIEFEGEFEGVKGVKSVIDAEKFDISFKYKIKEFVNSLKADLSPNIATKLILFFVGSAVFIYGVNYFLFRQNILHCLAIGQPVLLIAFMVKLRQMRKARFQNNFPDALNILSGALSAGQSIVHAFEYVGTQLDNEVGAEFRYMSERLLIGEDPDEVLARSSSTFPYIEYFFFASTIRLNLSRGGQLKDIIARINRIMFESRALDKKKFALTSEARGSAKIIAFLPVIFLLILRFTSPENYNFVMFEEGGKGIFYYVLFSELFGFFCISMILRGVG
ncbi:type II secretion system F family protein [uncultured Photobacterium sp.]|uniref:type II secretion system F family protein n=1 Tax=uncultured Photobacterium sp. TaxID=173973 RepID=UPI002601B94C|nr:type II secretion system F family protein [uncultured Photobacterium sp.]